MKRSSQHQSKSTKKNWLWSIVLILLILLVIYGVQVVRYHSQFLSNTTINGTSVSGLSAASAKSKLTKLADKNSFTLTDNNQTWKKLPKKELGLKVNYQDKIRTALQQQNAWLWFLPQKQRLSIEAAKLDETALKEQLSQLTTAITALNKDRQVTKNATIKKGTDAFEIDKEVQGTNIDVPKSIAAIEAALKKGNSTLELETYQAKPTILSTSEKIQKKLASMNQLVSISANYSINGNTIPISKSELMSFLVFDGTNVTVDQATVTSYVENLGKKYDTSTNSSTFKSTKRGTVSVPAGTYSWTIQTTPEVAALSKQLLEGKDFTRVPVTQGSTTADHALIGNTYIEVDKNAQHMWYYKDGKLVLETDVVTGKPATPTPSGVFYVWKKERNATLVGEDYKTPVDHWMPIDWSGVGLHDSPWQTAYGGTRYTTYGSHGCVNTPPSVMGTLYDQVAVGTPVIVF